MISTPIPAEPTGNPATESAVDTAATPDRIANEIALTLHSPVDTHGTALGIMATVALIFALDWAQPFLITLLLGILFACTLNPLVVWLERIRMPRIVGASMVMLAVICTIGFGAYTLRGQAKS